MSPVTEKLYTAFAPYKDELRLTQITGIRRPLHEMTDADFQAIGKLCDFPLVLSSDLNCLKHFLPRLLELYIDDFAIDDFDLGLLYRLKSTSWTQWNDDEVSAVRNFLREWWRKSPKESGTFGEIAEVETDLEPYLETWLAQNPRELASYLWGINWKKPDARIFRWARRSHVRAEFERLFFQETDAKTADFYSRTVALLENLG